MTKHSTETAQPYRVTRDGSIVERETGDEVGQVHRNDYGWTAELTTGQRTSMHATRRQACDTVWSLRRSSPPASTDGGEGR